MRDDILLIPKNIYTFSQKGDWKSVIKILKKFPNKYFFGHSKYPYDYVLYDAIFHARSYVVKALIKAGTSLERVSCNTNSDHPTAIQFAIDQLGDHDESNFRNKRNKIIELLIKNGADLTVKSPHDKQTPLVSAVLSYGSKYTAITTIAKSTTTKNTLFSNDIYNYRMALCIASSKLLKFFNERDRGGGDLFFSPNRNANSIKYTKKAITALLDSHTKFSFSLDCKDTTGNTALHYLISCPTDDTKDLIARFVKKGVDLTLRNNEGLTPLEIAIKNKKWPLIRIIAKSRKLNGSHAHQQDDSLKFGYALFHSVLKNKKHTAILLLKANAPLIDNIDGSGKSLLELAIAHANIDLILALLNRGASLSAKNKDGLTPIAYAASQNKWGLVEAIANHTSTKNSFFKNDTYDYQKALALAIENNAPAATIKVLIQKGADLSAKNTDDQTVFDLIALHQRADITGYLLENMSPDNTCYALSEFSNEEIIELNKLLGHKILKLKNPIQPSPHHERISFTQKEISLIKKNLKEIGTDQAKALSAKLLEVRITDKHIKKLIKSSVSNYKYKSTENTDEKLKKQEYYYPFANLFFTQTDTSTDLQENKDHYFNVVLFSLFAEKEASIKPILNASYMQFMGVINNKYFQALKNSQSDILTANINDILKYSRFNEKTIRKNVVYLIEKLKKFKSNNNIVKTELGKLYFFLGDYLEGIKYLAKASESLVLNPHSKDAASFEAFNILHTLATVGDNIKPDNFPDSAYSFSIKYCHELFIFRDTKKLITAQNFDGLKHALYSPQTSSFALTYLEKIAQSDNQIDEKIIAKLSPQEQASEILSKYYFERKDYEKATHWGFFNKTPRIVTKHLNSLLCDPKVISLFLSCEQLKKTLSNNLSKKFPDYNALISIINSFKNYATGKHFTEFLFTQPNLYSLLSFKEIIDLFSKHHTEISITDADRNALFSILLKKYPLDLMYSPYAENILPVLNSWEPEAIREKDLHEFFVSCARHVCNLTFDYNKLNHWVSNLDKYNIEKIIYLIKNDFSHSDNPSDLKIQDNAKTQHKRLLVIFYSYILQNKDNTNIDQLKIYFDCPPQYLSKLHPLFNIINQSTALTKEQKENWRKSIREYAFHLTKFSVNQIDHPVAVQQQYSKAINDPLFNENRHVLFNAIGIESNTVKKIRDEQRNALDAFFQGDEKQTDGKLGAEYTEYFSSLTFDLKLLEHWVLKLDENNFKKIIFCIKKDLYHSNNSINLNAKYNIEIQNKRLLTLGYLNILQNKDNPNINQLIEFFESPQQFKPLLYLIFKHLCNSNILNDKQKTCWRNTLRQYALDLINSPMRKINQKASSALEYSSLSIDSIVDKKQTEIMTRIIQQYQSKKTIFASDESIKLIKFLNVPNHSNQDKIESIKQYMRDNTHQNKTLYRVIQNVFIDFLTTADKIKDFKEDTTDENLAYVSAISVSRTASSQ